MHLLQAAGTGNIGVCATRGRAGTADDHRGAARVPRTLVRGRAMGVVSQIFLCFSFVSLFVCLFVCLFVSLFLSSLLPLSLLPLRGPSSFDFSLLRLTNN